MNPWRDPPEETSDYPGLWVHDNRVGGSITFGKTRLPLWAPIADIVRGGWSAGQSGWDMEDCGSSAEQLAEFLHALIQQRGEFARLLCVLADVERLEEIKEERTPWWRRANRRKRVLAALRRCVAALEAA